MVKKNEKGQAIPEPTIQMTREAFEPKSDTEIHWLGNAGMHLNIRGTNLMIDPLLQGFDMPILIESPVQAKDVPHLDGILITHIDNDHFSRDTLHVLDSVNDKIHAPVYVAEEAEKEGLKAQGHDIGESFDINGVKITLTPAKHNWQNEMTKPKYTYRTWNEEEYCGFWLDIPDGTIWMPGDSRLLPAHLEMPDPDVILFDFSDNPWHITLDGAIKLANQYPKARLIPIHWGTVDAFDQSPFNGDPNVLFERVDNPERICVLAPGETFHLSGE